MLEALQSIFILSPHGPPLYGIFLLKVILETTASIINKTEKKNKQKHPTNFSAAVDEGSGGREYIYYVT